LVPAKVARAAFCSRMARSSNSGMVTRLGCSVETAQRAASPPFHLKLARASSMS